MRRHINIMDEWARIEREVANCDHKIIKNSCCLCGASSNQLNLRDPLVYSDNPFLKLFAEHCNHEFKAYQGFHTESFDYCVKCDLKKVK